MSASTSLSPSPASSPSPDAGAAAAAAGAHPLRSAAARGATIGATLNAALDAALRSSTPRVVAPVLSLLYPPGATLVIAVPPVADGATVVERFTGIADIVCGLKNVELLGASLNVELEEFQYVPGSIMGRVEGTVQMADGYGGRYIRELTLCYCGVRWEVNTERLTLLFM